MLQIFHKLELKKHLKKHNLAISPFKCFRQKAISVAKINKR